MNKNNEILLSAFLILLLSSGLAYFSSDFNSEQITGGATSDLPDLLPFNAYFDFGGKSNANINDEANIKFIITNRKGQSITNFKNIAHKLIVKKEGVKVFEKNYFATKYSALIEGYSETITAEPFKFTTEGKYCLEVTADINNKVRESNENNNVLISEYCMNVKSECIPNWDCDENWVSNCPETNIKTRKCVDLNKCGTGKGIPAVTQKTDCTIDARKKELLNLIEKNPEKAFEYKELLPLQKLSLTSDIINQDVEKRGEFTGSLEVIHSDDFENFKTENEFYLRSEDNKKYQLFSSEELPMMMSGTKVKVNGLALDNKMAVKYFENNNQIFKVSGSPEFYSNENIGNKKVVVLVGKTEDGLPIINTGVFSILGIRNTVFNIANDDFVKYNSKNKMNLVGEVYGPFEVESSSICSYESLLNALISKAYNSGLKDELKKADNIMLIVRSDCLNEPESPFGRSVSKGWGSFGKRAVVLPNNEIIFAGVSWIFSPVTQRVIEHELGHNFRLGHANKYYCQYQDSTLTFSHFCESKEYGNPFSVMGNSGIGQLTGAEIDNMGWLNNDEVLIVDPSNKKELDLELAPINSFPWKKQVFSTPLKLIKLPVLKNKGEFYKKYNSIHYSLEFRQYPNGGGFILIHISKFNREPPVIQSNLIAFPGEYFRSQTPSLKVGESFNDKENGYSINFKEISDSVIAKVIISIKDAESSKDKILGTPKAISKVLPPTYSQPTSTKQYDSIFLSGYDKTIVPYYWAFTGNTLNVKLTVKNTGSETWTKAKGIKLIWPLSSANPWGVPDFIELSDLDRILPGQEKTFSFTITKPNAGSPSNFGNCSGIYRAGKFSFAWQMVQVGAGNTGSFGQRFNQEICV